MARPRHDEMEPQDDWEDIEPEDVSFQVWEPEELEDDDEPEPEEGDFWLERDDEEAL